MYLVSEDRLRNLDTRGCADTAIDDILTNPDLNSRNKVFALATAQERMDNITRPLRPQDTQPLITAGTPVESSINNLERRADFVVATVGKFQKNHAEKFVRFLRETGMDMTDAMEPTINGSVLHGANLSDLVHWVTNPVNQSYRPPQLESFMKILARSFMPATMIPNKDRRTMYAILQEGLQASAEVPQSVLQTSPQKIVLDTPPHKANLLIQQAGNGVRWSFY